MKTENRRVVYWHKILIGRRRGKMRKVRKRNMNIVIKTQLKVKEVFKIFSLTTIAVCLFN